MFAIRELYASLTIITVLSSYIVFWLHKSKLAGKGTLLWTYAMLSISCGLGLITLRGYISPELSIILSNSMNILGITILWYGIRQYVELPLLKWNYVLGALWISITGYGCYYFSAVAPSISMRITLTNSISAIPCTLLCYDLLRCSNKKFGKFLSTIYGITAILLVIRGLLAQRATSMASYLFSGWPTTALLLWTIFLILSTTFCLIMLLVEDQNNSLVRKANEDPLTGLFNRRAFHEMAPNIFLQPQEANTSLALLMLDLDHFKRINDSFGHATGDELLQHFSNQVASCLRPNDLMFRVGGEEFLIVIPNASPSMGTKLAEKIRTHVEKNPLINTNEAIPHTVSIGCTTACKKDSCLQITLNRADTALYAAKGRGRNCVETLFP